MNTLSSPLPPLALIAGPTASGKSALAMALAERADGVVINADSAQVYRDLRIVTARPTPEEEARVPHRLYGYRDGADPCSAAAWASDAKQVITDAHAYDRLPILVGGTGLYLRTLLEGIAPVPEIKPAIRAQVRAMATADAYAALAGEDPAAAARLQPADTSRVGRALEVIRSSGRTLSAWQQHKVGGIADTVSLRPLIVLPPRDRLYERCDTRFNEILSIQGINEIASLLARGLSRDLPVMRSIGVAEIGALLDGTIDREEALERGRIATRQYAKRQYTWFNRQPPTQWPRFYEPLMGASLAAALAMLIGDGEE